MRAGCFGPRTTARIGENRPLIGKRYNETGIAALRDGRVLAALRSEKGAHLAIAESADQGRTWSTPVQITKDLEHPAT